MAILFAEPEADRFSHIIARDHEALLSAGTYAEALIVAGRRNAAKQMAELIKDTSLIIVPVTAAFAEVVAGAYEKWGKGAHPARLNFGDCFAYSLAATRNCALLYKGDDFSRTDVRAA